MKKMALLVGSLLVVSAAASAKEVVKAPVMKPEVQVVEKVVVKEVPVERVVVKEVPVEKVVVKEVFKGGKGKFDVSYGFPVYGHEFGKDFTKFTEFEREGTLKVSAEAEVANKHTVFASAEAVLNLVPKKVEGQNKITKLNVGYKYNDKFDKVGFELKNTLSYEKDKKAFTVAPKFELKDFIVKSDNFEVTSLAFVPVYKLEFENVSLNENHQHNVILGAKTVAKVPYDVKATLDLAKFYEWKVNEGAKGTAQFKLEKEWELYKEGKHGVDLELAGSAKFGWTWFDNSENVKYQANDLEFKLGSTVKYTYKVNDQSSVYASVSPEFVSKKDLKVKDSKFTNKIGAEFETGLNEQKQARKTKNQKKNNKKKLKNEKKKIKKKRQKK